MKKFLSILLSIMMVMGCAGLTAAMADEPTKLTVWVPEDLRIEDYNTNEMTLWLEQQGNLDLEMVTQPSGADYLTKINMALMAGSVSELPDVILFNNNQASDTQIWEWAQAGTIVPLTEYYKDPELAKNINEAIERTGSNYPAQITSPDGNIYGIATLNQSYGNEYGAKQWFSASMLAAAGCEIPTTTDELYEVLKKVVAADTNGNGKADEIGLLGTFGVDNNMYRDWFCYIMNAFVYAGDAQFRTVDNGVVGLAYTTEEWKEGLKFLNKLFSEGLIASETLTLDVDTFKALMNNEDQIVLAMNYAAPDMISDSERTMDYVVAAPLKGHGDRTYAKYSKSTACVSFVVTANCKNPEAAFRLGDLMSSEYIGISQRWGSEGAEWDYIANVADADSYVASVSSFPISIVTYHDAAFWGGSDVANKSWRQHGPYVRQYGIACGVGIDPAKSEPYTIMLNGAWDLYQQGGYAPDETIPKLIYTSEESDEISEIEATLRSYVYEKTAAFMLGNEDIDAGWDEFQQELKNIGCETYLEIEQAVYDRMYK